MIGGKYHHVINHDFLLAATILCLDLDHDLTAGVSSTPSEELCDDSRRDDVISALLESNRIWLQSSSSSREARKAVEALKIVLGKAKRADVIKIARSSHEPPNLLPIGNAAPAFSMSMHTLYYVLIHSLQILIFS